MRTVTLSNLTSTLIVAAFAAIGLNSHVGQNADFDLSSVIDGSTQSIYEDGFKSANPMKSFAIDQTPRRLRRRRTLGLVFEVV